MPQKMLFMLSALLVVVNGKLCSTCQLYEVMCHDVYYVYLPGQSCITANNRNGTTGLPTFQNYRLGSELNADVIPHLHQAIIPSYRLNCCGYIVVWGVDVSPDGTGIDRMFTLDLQIWRPSPTVNATGCYSLVGNNRFTSVELDRWVAVVTPLPRERIQFQPGDVLGFYVESARGGSGEGVVILSDLNVQDDRGYETEEVWYARNPVIGSIGCPYPVGSTKVLNTFARAAPVISPSIRELVPN